MPTSTFFNLPAEKRIKLLCAIRDEFSRVQFDKVSINKIIHAAEISRGSFYQYFADKHDMLDFVLTEYKKQMLVHAKASLQANNGNIFELFYDILEFTISFTTEESGHKFCKNLFADIKVNSDFYLKKPECPNGMEWMNELQPFININMLDVRDKEDFNNMLGILSSVCRDATAEVFLNLADREHTKQNYKQKLELLKRGFINNKE